MTPATDEHADRVMGAATRLRRRLSSEAGFDLRERLQASVRTIGGHTSVTPAVTGRAGWTEPADVTDLAARPTSTDLVTITPASGR